jgi:hypothetical protein
MVYIDLIMEVSGVATHKWIHLCGGWNWTLALKQYMFLPQPLGFLSKKGRMFSL